MIKMSTQFLEPRKQLNFLDLLNEMGIQYTFDKKYDNSIGYKILNVSQEDVNLFKLCNKDKFRWQEKTHPYLKITWLYIHHD